jgi:ribosomal-protein-alanine N-acetyltransferase
LNSLQLKGDFIAFNSIYIKFTLLVAGLKKKLRSIFGAYILKEWKSVEKEDIVYVDDIMLPEVLNIQAEAFDSENQENLIRYAKKLRKIFYVIKSQDKIAGYCTYYLDLELTFKGLRKKSVIYSIATDNQFRGKGYARKLLEESIKEMKINGIYSILLYVNVKNTPAINLYEKMGFQIINKKKDICGQSEKCYLMELKLA